MKKFFLISYALCVSLVAFGQVEVLPNGNVSCNKQLTISRSVQGSTATSYGVHSQVNQVGGNLPYGDCIGVYGFAGNGSNVSFLTRYIGVLGQAYSNMSSTKAQIGVAGTASYISGSIGIYGGTYDSALIPPLNFTTTYAGYFSGPVYVTGNLTALSVTQSSDERLKQNVRSINNDVTRNLMLLNPVLYNLKQIERQEVVSDTRGEDSVVVVKRYDEESQVFQKQHYGFLAQKLQRIYPNLVYEGGDGYLEVDYIGIIPLLVSSIQELNEKNAVLESTLRSVMSAQNAPAKPQETTSETVAALYQNTPNPFNENTEIAFYLPQSVTNAMLCVYDMNGRQLTQNVITQRGSSVFVVNGNQYGAGMYLYSLIADNQIIDTKILLMR